MTVSIAKSIRSFQLSWCSCLNNNGRSETRNIHWVFRYVSNIMLRTRKYYYIVLSAIRNRSNFNEYVCCRNSLGSVFRTKISSLSLHDVRALDDLDDYRDLRRVPCVSGFKPNETRILAITRTWFQKRNSYTHLYSWIRFYIAYRVLRGSSVTYENSSVEFIKKSFLYTL